MTTQTYCIRPAERVCHPGVGGSRGVTLRCGWASSLAAISGRAMVSRQCSGESSKTR